MMTEEREQFEAWAKSKHDSQMITKGNGYADPIIQLMWQAWRAALTQPASPALKLPDEMDADHPRMRWVGMSEVWGRIQGWNDCLAEVKRLNAPHTAPIEPICATGGAEWVKVPREPTRQMMSQGHFAMAGTDRGKFRRIYQAMIAAAPQPE